jgi:hypothetical protein
MARESDKAETGGSSSAGVFARVRVIGCLGLKDKFDSKCPFVSGVQGPMQRRVCIVGSSTINACACDLHDASDDSFTVGSPTRVDISMCASGPLAVQRCSKMCILKTKFGESKSRYGRDKNNQRLNAGMARPSWPHEHSGKQKH